MSTNRPTPMPATALLAHVALWTRDLDAASAFWRDHFAADIGDLYRSRRQPGFLSRFARLPGQQVVLELMQAPWVAEADPQTRAGWAHLALSLGSQAAVDATAARLDAAGLLISPPRQTGDGFYEAVVRTPDGIPIEITV